MTARARPGEQNLFCFLAAQSHLKGAFKLQNSKYKALLTALAANCLCLRRSFHRLLNPEAGLQVLQRCYGMLWHWSEFPNPA